MTLRHDEPRCTQFRNNTACLENVDIADVFRENNFGGFGSFIIFPFHVFVTDESCWYILKDDFTAQSIVIMRLVSLVIL